MMVKRLAFSVRGILLDIEGTTSSIHFVYEVMFPFVRRELESFLAWHWGDPSLMAALDQMARDAGSGSWDEWKLGADSGEGSEQPPVPRQQQFVIRETLLLMDQDVKSTGLKQLQGLIWEAGFRSGELQAHVYEDVPDALHQWSERQIDVRIYSSGSVAAQRLFFSHTIAGDLLPLLRGHYDTSTGPKRESASYTRIAEAMGRLPSEILFLSDVVAELDAAQEAGMWTVLCRRPGNAEPAPHSHPELHSFSELHCTLPTG
jgi:enolase-phosphatase E1